MKYPDFDKAIQLCIREGQSCSLGRSDFRSAFRNLGMNKWSWKFLIMMAKSLLDGEVYYFVDKCLPFGASISCSHFQRVSNAVAHIVKYRTRKDLVNYLDDFLFVTLLKMLCNSQLETFLQVCEEISFPISPEKTFWASTCIVFLGLLINTVSHTVSVPTDKISKVKRLKKFSTNQAGKSQ